MFHGNNLAAHHGLPAATPLGRHVRIATAPSARYDHSFHASSQKTKTPATVNRAVEAAANDEPAILREDSPEYGALPHIQRQCFTCIDLFAGCGGLALGLEQAGFRPLLFSELNKSAAETYIANRVGKSIIPWGDVYQLTDENLELLKLNWLYEGIGDIDLVCGGPPCQGFSGIGHSVREASDVLV